jgi:hypothetical protein
MEMKWKRNYLSRYEGNTKLCFCTTSVLFMYSGIHARRIVKEDHIVFAVVGTEDHIVFCCRWNWRPHCYSICCRWNWRPHCFLLSLELKTIVFCFRWNWRPHCFLFSFEFGSPTPPAQYNRKAWIGHTDRRRTKREGREVVIITV